MDRIDRYRQIARDVIRDYSQHKVSHGDIQTEGVIDPARDHYEVIQTGWDRGQRVHGMIIYFDIIDGNFGCSTMAQTGRSPSNYRLREFPRRTSYSPGTRRMFASTLATPWVDG